MYTHIHIHIYCSICIYIYALYSINLLASFASLGFFLLDFSFALYSTRVVVVLAAALRSSRLLAHLFCYTHTRIHAHTNVAATPTVPVICLSFRHIQVLQVCVCVSVCYVSFACKFFSIFYGFVKPKYEQKEKRIKSWGVCSGYIAL